MNYLDLAECGLAGSGMIYSFKGTYDDFVKMAHDADAGDMSQLVHDFLIYQVYLIADLVTFMLSVTQCMAAFGPSQDTSIMMNSLKNFEQQALNLPAMEAKLIKYKAEILEDIMSAAFYLKTEQYEKFGEFFGNFVKVVAEKEVQTATTQPENLFLY